MIPQRRLAFNSSFTPQKYADFLRRLDSECGMHVGFRVSETPLFITADFEHKLHSAALEILEQVMSPEHRARSEDSFPPNAAAPNESHHPEFVQVDFAVVQDADGAPDIKLIELQGFPSLYGFQEANGFVAKNFFGLEGMRHISRGFTRDAYYDHLRKTILGRHEAENVVLLEVDPFHQKTRPDFCITERMVGIETVDITTVEKEGRKLFYRKAGTRTQIHRIFNRAIIDEIERKNLALPFNFTDDLDVEWACHPNWFYRISKHSIPYIKHPTVPETRFLHQLDRMPDDLEHYVLKPLFSFAGSGVIISPTREEIQAVPKNETHHFLLQRKVEYAPVLDTPSGWTKVELRVMILWDEQPDAVNILVRTGRGKMMGVDYNKNLDWVGATCCLVED